MALLSLIKYPVCPICGNSFRVEETEGWKIKMHHINYVRSFLCLTPLASDPLHHYNHIVDTSAPDQIAFQEFSLDLGYKNVFYANDYYMQQSLIKNSMNGDPLVFPVMLEPDFPQLKSLKSKIRTILTFS